MENNKFQEALNLICNENYELDIFLEKYPQVQMDWNNSNGFKNHIKEITNFENKYGDMPAGVLQKLVDYHKEKETPVKPIKKHYETEGEEPYIKCICPKCNRYPMISAYKYCPNCGQKLDWKSEGEL